MANPSADNAQVLGAIGMHSIPERLRKYAQDKEFFRFWALRNRHKLSFLKVISEKFGTVPVEAMSDYEFKYPEFDGVETFFYIKAGSNLADKTLLSVTNDTAAILRDTNRVAVQGIFTTAAPTQHSHFATSRNPATGIIYPEILRVIEVGNTDSDGSGYTKVRVKRGHPADSIDSVASVPEITSDMRLSLSNIVSKENSTVGTPFYKNSKYQWNVLQLSRHPYGVTEFMNAGGGVETYVMKGPEFLEAAYIIAERYFMETIEKAILLGKRTKKVSGNSLEYETGGILEFIGSANNYSNVSNFCWNLNGQVPTQQRLNEIFVDVSQTLSVSEIHMFVDRNAGLAITNALEGKLNYLTENMQLSMEYDLSVKTYHGIGVPLTVHVIVAPILNEIGLDNTALLLNLNCLNKDEKNKMGTFQIGHKVPFKDLPEGKASYQEDTGYQGIVRELYGVWGLVRRLPETHGMIVNFPAPNF